MLCPSFVQPLVSKVYPSSGIREKHGMSMDEHIYPSSVFDPGMVPALPIRTLGVCIPVYRGAVGFLPLRKPVHLVLGAPLELSCQVPGKPTDEEVQQAHARYMEALLLGFAGIPKPENRLHEGKTMVNKLAFGEKALSRSFCWGILATLATGMG